MAKGPRALSILLRGTLDPIARKRGFSTAEILLRWEAIAGADLAAHARPERVAWPRSGEDESAGVLHLLVRPAMALEVQYGAAQILERVNMALGWRALRALRLRQTFEGWETRQRAKAPPPLSPGELEALDLSVAAIEDPELRHSLRALGAAVAHKPLSGRA